MLRSAFLKGGEIFVVVEAGFSGARVVAGLQVPVAEQGEVGGGGAAEQEEEQRLQGAEQLEGEGKFKIFFC